MKQLLLRSLFVLPLLGSIGLGQTLYTPGGTVGNISGSNVGIGTNNPQQKLEVAGYARSSGLQLFGGGQLQVQWWNTDQAGTNQQLAELIEQNGQFVGRFVNDAYSAADSWLVVNRNSGTYTVKNVTFPAGNVGIGTLNPWAALTFGDVAGKKIGLYSGGDWALGIEAGEMRIAMGTGIGDHIAFYSGGYTAGSEKMRISGNGNVGIGTANPTYPLTVNGTVRAKEVIVDTGWSDYVFDKNYKLPALSETEAAIKSEKHLPGIPSAQEVAEHGISVGEMQAKLLAKIEELTLHQIEQEKRISHLEQENQKLHAKLSP